MIRRIYWLLSFSLLLNCLLGLNFSIFPWIFSFAIFLLYPICTMTLCALGELSTIFVFDLVQRCFNWKMVDSICWPNNSQTARQLNDMNAIGYVLVVATVSVVLTTVVKSPPQFCYSKLSKTLHHSAEKFSAKSSVGCSLIQPVRVMIALFDNGSADSQWLLATLCVYRRLS